MLLPEHVMAQRRGDKLIARKLDEASRARAVGIAGQLVGITLSHQGALRSDFEAALGAVDIVSKDTRVRAGLTKLVLDRCTFESEPAVASDVVRRELFTRAAVMRKATGKVDRDALVSATAAALHVSAATLEQALYADLKGSHPLVSFDAITPEALVSAFERGQAQAVLLRAERIAARVKCASPGALRAMLRKLKFLRLLFTVQEDAGAFVLSIDGPMSLFEAGTKYGLQLALALPALESCDELELEALVRWGKTRDPLVFRYDGGAGSTEDDAPLPDEVAALARSIEAGTSGWKVKRGQAILNLPGVGVCVPDLELVKKGRNVYVEVLGFWSRDAVWKRVELASKGLGAPVVFCASSRLRVSEEVLGPDADAALYVYKGVMSARAVVERADKLAARPKR